MLNVFSLFPQQLRAALKLVSDPCQRYRHARLIHAIRIAFGILFVILLTTQFHIPHGEWSLISMLVVTGGLQYHGQIRQKAFERAVGTLLGATIGMFIITEQLLSGFPPLVAYLLLAIACGTCGAYAVDKGGYIALLAAITVVIVAGPGETTIADALWRTINVWIGAATALLLTCALPLYATVLWRYTLADALRECATLHASLLQPSPATEQRHQKAATLAKCLTQLRSLMPSVAKEVKIPASTLENLQSSLRLCLSTLELLSAASSRLGHETDPAQALASLHAFDNDGKQIEDTLLQAADALESGRTAPLEHSLQYPVPVSNPDLLITEYGLLTTRLAQAVDRLRIQLLDTASCWNFKDAARA